MTQLGYWYSVYQPDLPHPTVNPQIDPTLRLRAVSWLNNGKLLNSYRGFSTCRICGCVNGSIELGRDGYVYPEGLVHYITDHNVWLPEFDQILSAV